MAKERYSDIIRGLENDLERIGIEMKEHVFTNYTTFVETFKELRGIENFSLENFDPAIEALEEAMNDLLSDPGSILIQNTSTKTIGSEEWWQELPDELDMLLHEEKYEECIGLIQDSQSVPVNQKCLKSKLEFDVYILKVIETISKHLLSTDIASPEVYIEYLRRLDSIDVAEQAYFQSKSNELESFIKRITYQDEALEMIDELNEMFFSLIRRTAFESKEFGLSQAELYEWMKEEIEIFVSLIGEQLYLIDSVKDLSEAVKLMIKASKSLNSHGMSIEWHFQRAVLPFLQERLQEIYSKFEYAITEEIATEYWKPQVLQVALIEETEVIRFTSSAYFVYECAQTLIEDAKIIVGHSKLISAGMGPIFIETVTVILDKYIESEKYDTKREDKVVLSIVCNLWNIANLIPTVAKELLNALEARSLEIEEFIIAGELSISRGNDLLKAFLDEKWKKSFNEYLKAIRPIKTLQTQNEISSFLNAEHLKEIKNLLENISSATNRNEHIKSHASKILINSYSDCYRDFYSKCLTEQENLQNMHPAAFEQFLYDFYIFEEFSKDLGIIDDVAHLIDGLFDKYIQSYSKFSEVLRFLPEIYQEKYASISFSEEMETFISLEGILDNPENEICVDCQEKEVKFANIPNAVFICENCKSWHEKYNRHISVLKALTENFSVYELKLLSVGGNSSFKNFSVSYGLEKLVPTCSKYNTYASECYRNMLKVTASGGDFEEEWPDLAKGRIGIRGFVENSGNFTEFGEKTASLYQSACRKGEDVMKAFGERVESNETAVEVGNTLENFMGEVEGLTNKGY